MNDETVIPDEIYKEPAELAETIETQQIESEPEPEKITKGAQRRIDELVRQKHDERRRADNLANELDELRSKGTPKEPERVTPTGAPDPDKYPAGRYDPDYLEARQDWQIEQRFAKQDAAKQETVKQGTIAQLEAVATEQHSDYAQIKADFFSHDLTGVTAFIELIKESENPAELAYFLGKNPEEMDKLGEMTPAAANRYIGRLEARMTEAPTQPNKKTTSAAPKPINPLGGTKGSVSAKDPANMTMEEYTAYRKGK